MSERIIQQKTLAEAIKDDKFSFLDSMADYHDLQMIDKQSILLLLQMNKLNSLLAENERAKAGAEIKYKRAYRAAYIKHIENGTNETHRKLLAEVECEPFELEVAKLETYNKEYTRLLGKIKVELDTLKTIGFHIQQELKAV